MFKTVLHRDVWGLQQVVVACLSTGDQGMETSPYLAKKTNYQFFSEALCPGTAPVEGDSQDIETSDAADITQESP